MNDSFNFKVDKSNNTVLISRDFSAELPLVWDAFTKPGLLDQWGAPEPWKTQTIYMDFKVGGRRFYKMTSSEGQEFYSVQDFTSITPMTNYKYISGFSDKDENINPELYGSETNLDFTEVDGITTLNMSMKYKDYQTLEMIANERFKEGIKMTLNIVEQILATKAK